MRKPRTKTPQTFKDAINYLGEMKRKAILAMENERIINSPPDRQKISVSVLDKEHYGGCESLIKYRDWIDGLIQKIPEDCRVNATIEVDDETYYDSSYVRIQVSYWRWETDSEMVPRLQRRSELIAASQMAKEARDRAALAALKAKYESS